MATLASAILAAAWGQLTDDGTRWPETTLLAHLHEAMVVTALLKPEANPTTVTVTLVPGTRQTLPAGATGLVRPIRNRAGTAFGKVPPVVAPEVMDGVLPDWHSRPARAEVSKVVYSPDDPKVFGTYPPQPAGTTQALDMLVGMVPTAVAANQNIPLGDEYVPALTDYVIYRAFAKDTDVPETFSRSQSALQTFSAKLGVPVKAVQAAQAQRTYTPPAQAQG